MPVDPSVPTAGKTETANGFDLLRCVLAAMVIYSHSFYIGGYAAEPFRVWSKMQAVLGELGVIGFFGLSGYFVTASYSRSSGLTDYFTKRVRRIVPGFWACLVVTACVLAPAIYALHLGSLTGFPWLGNESSALAYVVGNLAVKITTWTVTGTLDGAFYSGSLNGSLWSLWPETLCYLMVAGLGIAGLFGRNRSLLLLGTGLLFAFHVARILLPSVEFPLLPTWVVLIDHARLFLAYLVGSILWLWRDRYQPAWPIALLTLGLLAALARFGGLQAFAPVLVPLALVLLGGCFTLRLRDDLSYGLYIYGFPVQQLLAATALPRTVHWSVFFLLSLLVTALLALLSWRLVERRFIHRRPVLA
jgi:peptidoglycan/LPS O-acetylase OafA/YrhL